VNLPDNRAGTGSRPSRGPRIDLRLRAVDLCADQHAPSSSAIVNAYEFVAVVPPGWLAVDMSDKEFPQSSDLPADRHLRDDVMPASEEEREESPEDRFTPGQTNAGQQVAGLASATSYGEEQDPDSQGDPNNPV
jgi:hypothetical protein